jgi:hypothetical protein
LLAASVDRRLRRGLPVEGLAWLAVEGCGDGGFVADASGMQSARRHALAETTVGSFKTELIRRQDPGATSITSGSRP